MARTTIEIATIKSTVNHALQHSTCTPDVRHGMISVLEEILQITNNYKGFTYLQPTYVPTGQKPGINADMYGNVSDENKFTDCDETRRRYV